MAAVPAGIFVVLRIATPLVFSGADPRLVVPAVNLTLPVGPPGALDVTVAVNRTVWPNVIAFGAAVTVVVVGYKLTT